MQISEKDLKVFLKIQEQFYTKAKELNLSLEETIALYHLCQKDELKWKRKRS